jgi:nucleoside-diphosphate-sugar epimerase
MKVLVAGAAGVMGRQLPPRLRESGHRVVGMTRCPRGAETVRELGAEPVIADALDPGQVARTVAEAEAARLDATHA